MIKNEKIIVEILITKFFFGLLPAFGAMTMWKKETLDHPEYLVIHYA